MEDLGYWVGADRKTALRALEMVAAVLGDQFSGIGTPARLKYLAAGARSRRLVYLVREERIDFLQAHYHY